MLTESPRRVLIYHRNDLVPKRLTPGETCELLQGMRSSVEPVIDTSRLQGSDLIVRMLGYIGDKAKPSVPRSPVASDQTHRRFSFRRSSTPPLYLSERLRAVNLVESGRPPGATNCPLCLEHLGGTRAPAVSQR